MAIRVLALMLPPLIVKSKKVQKNSKIISWQRMTNVLSACQVSLGNNIRGDDRTGDFWELGVKEMSGTQLGA